MKSTLLNSDRGEQTYVLIFDKGDELMSTLKQFAVEHGIAASHFTAIGAFQDAVLGYFDRDQKDYLKIPIMEQVEVLSLIGDISEADGKPNVHAHAVVGLRDGSTRGHVLEAHIWPTLEVVLEQTPKHLRRTLDPEIGLPLIDLRQPTEP